MATLIISACFLFAYMCVAYIIGVMADDNSIADVAYGGGFAIVAWTSYLEGLESLSGLVVSILVTIWGLRIAAHTYQRTKGRGEDFRFKKWRNDWGKHFLWRSFLQIYLLQALIILVVALPVIFLNKGDITSSISLLGWLGIIIWLKGFIFEVVGDRELDAFLNKPENKGHIITTGLFKYTRHPNYYGEALVWWGIAILAYGQLGPLYGYAISLACFISPILITYLLLKVSGVPMVEKHLAGPEWEAYKAKTSKFIPWFPKK